MVTATAREVRQVRRRTAGILAYSGLKALAVNGTGHPADAGRMLA